MPDLQNLKSLFNRAPADAVGINHASNGLRVVRMKKNGNELSVASAAILEPVAIEDGAVEPLSLPIKLRGRYAALSLPSRPAAVKLLRVPDTFDPGNTEEVMARMAREDNDEVRLATRVLIPGAHKVEARLLAAIMPEAHAAGLLRLMPAAGVPAARAIELAELAVINAFHNDSRFADDKQPRGLIHFDHDFSLIALFNENLLSQIRIFPFGVVAVLQKVSKALNVDEATAEGVLMDGAFDISHLIEDGFRDIRGQLVICRDFMERSENCSLEQIYVSGPASLVRPFTAGMPNPEQVEAWDVLAAYPEAADHIAEELTSDSWRFAAAVGSCLGVLLPS